MNTKRAVPALVAAVTAAILLSGCATTVPPAPSATTSPSAASGSQVAPASLTPTTGPSVEPAPTPTPTTAPTPAPTAPAPTPTAPAGSPSAHTYRAGGEIGDALFAPDGRIVVVEQDWVKNQPTVVTLDENGALLPGWPWSPGPIGTPIARAALGPDGSVYVAVRGAEGSPQTYTWALHRLDPMARELAGFPVDLPAVPFCALTTSADGYAYATCEEDNESTGAATTTVRAVRPDGTTAPGWPVRLSGSGAIAGFRADGSAVVLAGGAHGSRITVLARDGTRAAGWPRPVADGASVTIDGRDRLHVVSHAWSEGQCGPATRTTYTVLRRDGSRAPGWPLTIRGWASEPLVADDGSMTIVTGAGFAVAYRPDGKVKAGWPVRRVGVAEGCYGGSTPVSAGRDGVMVTGQGKATLISRAGSVSAGWPVRLPYRIAINCPSCTPGPAGPLDPAVGERGVYVGAYRGDHPRIVAIDRDGSLPSDRQAAPGKTGDEILFVRVAPSGRVWAALSRWVQATESVVGLLVPVAEDRPLGS